MDALHAIERSALEHVEGAPAADLLRRLADVLGRTQIMMTSVRESDDVVVLGEAAYVEPNLLHVLRTRYDRPETNPFMKAMPRFVPDRLAHFTAFASWDDVLGSAFYADFWAPTQVWHAGHMLVRFTPDWGISFAFGAHRDRDWYEGEEARLAVAGAQVAARAIRLRTELADAQALAAAVPDAARFVLLVSGCGKVLTGPVGTGTVLCDLGLGSSDGRRLAPRNGRVRVEINHALGAALAGGTTRIAVAEGRRAILTVDPGPSWHQRRSAIVRIDLPTGPVWTPAMLAASFGLTRREGEVALRLCAGRSTAEVATDIGIAVSSVRIYLTRAMSKIGVRTQAQLVSALLLPR